MTQPCLVVKRVGTLANAVVKRADVDPTGEWIAGRVHVQILARTRYLSVLQDIKAHVAVSAHGSATADVASEHVAPSKGDTLYVSHWVASQVDSGEWVQKWVFVATDPAKCISIEPVVQVLGKVIGRSYLRSKIAGGECRSAAGKVLWSGIAGHRGGRSLLDKLQSFERQLPDSGPGENHGDKHAGAV